MSIFKIPKIEKETFYIDSAMDAMQQFAIGERERIEKRFKNNSKIAKKTIDEIKLDKRKDLELEKIRFLNDRLNINLKKLIKQYPKFAKIDDIYKKLINTTEVKVATIEDSLKRIQWIANTVDEFTKRTESKLKRARTQQTVGFLMKKYLGKVNSLFKKNKTFFKQLEESRNFMNKLPKFEDLFTVSIGGFPNVGKSTLMSKVTGSNVEIQNYPFTTKGLMFGYLKHGNVKTIQLIDTPGLLGRDKQNDIEKRAQIVLSDYSDIIVFVLDLTESCGYNVKSQIKLLKQTRESGKKIVLYLSKTDIFSQEDDEKREEFKRQINKFELFESFEKLKSYLLAEQSKNKKFDIKKIKVIH